MSGGGGGGRAARGGLGCPCIGREILQEAAAKVGVSEGHLLYARILETGIYIGLLLLLLTFAVYVLGVFKPAVPVEELPRYWSMNAHEYLQATNRDHRTTCTGLRGGPGFWFSARVDYLSYPGIVTLSAITVLCFLGIIPTLLRKKDVVYATMSLLEVLILALAANGILRTGGH